MESDTESFLTAPGLPSLQYTSSSDIKLIPASYDGTSTPTLTDEGHGPGTLYDDLRYSFSWYINDWHTNTAYGTTSLGSGVPDAYKSMFGSPDITSSTSLTNKRCNFGRAVAASKDGKIVAVSGRSWNGAVSTQNDDYNGYVEVYQYSTDTLSWSQLGTTIYGNVNGLDKTAPKWDGTGDENIHNATGFSLDISDDGTILVVGEPEFWVKISGSGNDFAQGGGKYVDAPNTHPLRKVGKVRVFKYGTLVDGTNDWLQIGDDIIGENNSTQGNARFGSSVAYLEYTDNNNDKKKVVCVGAPDAQSQKGYVGLYEFASGVNTETTWNLSVQQNSSGQNKYKFTNAADSNDVYGQIDSTTNTVTDLPLEYGSKHIFDYSNITNHPFIIHDMDGTSTSPGTYPQLDGGDYNALNVEYDDDNNRVILIIKETHRRTREPSSGYGGKHNLVGKISYSCKTHNYLMQEYTAINTCWSGENAISDNLYAPRRLGGSGTNSDFLLI